MLGVIGKNIKKNLSHQFFCQATPSSACMTRIGLTSTLPHASPKSISTNTQYVTLAKMFSHIQVLVTNFFPTPHHKTETWDCK
jgi:hypothetical protein